MTEFSGVLNNLQLERRMYVMKMDLFYHQRLLINKDVLVVHLQYTLNLKCLL